MSQPDRQFFDTVSAALRDRTAPSSLPGAKGDGDKIAAGIKIYRNNVRASLTRALEARFPVIEALVGDAFFKHLAAEFFYAHPPTPPLLSKYGDAMPDFLTSFEPARGLAYLPDMARLEIAWLRSYHAGDIDALSHERVLSAAKDGDIGALHFQFHPSLYLLSSAFRIGAIWERHQRGGAEKIANAATGECVLVARKNNTVTVEIISAGLYAAMNALAGGACLTTALNAATAQEAQFDPQNLFETLFRLDLITGATPTQT